MAKQFDARVMRAKLKMNQQQFWSKIGVTQSGGSRYESGRDIPEPTAKLIDLAYGNTPLATLAKLRGVTVDQLKAGK